MESLLFFFVFITAFQAVGLVTLGTTLRGIILEVRQHGWRGVRNVNAWLPRLIVGVAFALIATLAGYSQFTPLLRILHIVFGLAIFITSLIGIRGRLFLDLQTSQVAIIAFGAVFFIIGMATAGQMLRQHDIFPAIIFGLFFSGLGAATMIIGLRKSNDG